MTKTSMDITQTQGSGLSVGTIIRINNGKRYRVTGRNGQEIIIERIGFIGWLIRIGKAIKRILTGEER